MRVGDKIRPLHHPILKPANLPDFLAGARTFLEVLPTSQLSSSLMCSAVGIFGVHLGEYVDFAS